MEHVSGLISKYLNKGLLIDTNLLLLHFVGSKDPERIQKFKRTMIFTLEEFEILEKFFQLFNNVVTTPNVLTEVSNLLAQLPENLHPAFLSDFGTGIKELEEHYSSSVDVAAFTHFNRFGLTDSGIAELVRGRYLVLTDDLPLYGYLVNSAIDAINFNHIRQYYWS